LDKRAGVGVDGGALGAARRDRAFSRGRRGGLSALDRGQGGGIRRGLVATAVAGAGIVAFHLVAAGRLSPLALVVPPVALVIEAFALLRRTTWS